MMSARSLRRARKLAQPQPPSASFALEALVAAGGRVAAFSVLRTSGTVTRFADLYVLRDGRIAEHRHVVEPLSGALR